MLKSQSDQATSMANPCVADTWHWSNFGISQSVPFTIINGSPRSANAASTTVNFPAGAPANSFLRFEAIGTIQMSFDGGHTFQAARRQPIIGDHGVIHDEHFSPYFTPIPAGVSSVLFSGQGGWFGPWWLRDPSIWSDQNTPAVVVPPAQSNPPTQAPVNPPANPPTNPPTTGTGHPPTAGTGHPPTTAPGNPATKSPASGGTGESGGSATGSGGTEGSTPAPIEKARELVTVLVAAVNPNHEPAINLVLVLLAVGAAFALFRAIRG